MYQFIHLLSSIVNKIRFYEICKSFWIYLHFNQLFRIWVCYMGVGNSSWHILYTMYCTLVTWIFFEIVRLFCLYLIVSSDRQDERDWNFGQMTRAEIEHGLPSMCLYQVRYRWNVSKFNVGYPNIKFWNVIFSCPFSFWSFIYIVKYVNCTFQEEGLRQIFVMTMEVLQEFTHRENLSAQMSSVFQRYLALANQVLSWNFLPPNHILSLKKCINKKRLYQSEGKFL